MIRRESHFNLVLTFALLITALTACNFNSSTLNMDKVGFAITFPCKYEAATPPSSFSCRIDKQEEYRLSFVAPPVTQYETRKSIYEGFAKMALESGSRQGNLVERQIDGLRVLDYTENEYENGDTNKPIQRRRYVDLYKDGNLFEITATARRDYGTDISDFEKRIMKNFEPFFESMKPNK